MMLLGLGNRSVSFGVFVIALLGSVAVLAACGGISSTPLGSATRGTPASTSTSVPLTGAAGSSQTIALPNADGYSGTILLTLANAVSGVAAGVSVGASPPPGAPAPTGTDQPLVFVGLSVSGNVALAAIPGFILTVPDAELQSIRRSPKSGVSDVVLDFFDPSNPLAGYQSGESCSSSGATVTCTGGSASFNLLAQLQYVFELAQHDLAPVAAPTPTTGAAGGTAVIIVPTPAPIVCSPASDIVGVNQTNYIDCTQPGYGGAFAISVADPTIASVQQANSLTFTFFGVTGLRAGSTTLSLQSQSGSIVSVPISVPQ